jgi:hypothetical protein
MLRKTTQRNGYLREKTLVYSETSRAILSSGTGVIPYPIAKLVNDVGDVMFAVHTRFCLFELAHW